MTSPTRVILPPKRAGEAKPFPFDFTSLLLANDAILTATATISVWSGVDPSPSAILVSTTISGLVVSVNLQNGVAGVIYLIAVAITTNLSGSPELDGLVAIIPQGL